MMEIKKVKDVDPMLKRGALALKLGGMGLVTFGYAGLGLILFAIGLVSMEWVWRQERDFQGTMDDRWAYTKWFYASTHQDAGNRLLHRLGIPIILAGGFLLLYTPIIMDAVYGRAWWVGLTLWVVGWVLNLYGHKYLEGASPALADDPLGTLAGPYFDFTGRLKDSTTSDLTHAVGHDASSNGVPDAHVINELNTTEAEEHIVN